MLEPKEFNFVIQQGAKFEHSFHWYGGGKTGGAIEAVTTGYPTIIQLTGHGLPSASPTPIYINDVKGSARVLNTGKRDCDMVLATYIDLNTFSVPISTVGKVYTANSGYIEWYMPKDLTGWTARMQIRDYKDDTVALVDLTWPSDFNISLSDARITFTIASAVTEGLNFFEGVYDLELVDPSDEAYRALEGIVTLSKEVTR